jgi:ketosteroid isomerase-like protein
MSWRVALFCLLTGVSAVSASASQPQGVQSDQEILIRLEQDWDDAFHRRDVAFIGDILADDFVATHADGTRADKAQELALVAAFSEQIDSSMLDDFSVKVYGDTAVVRFAQHLRGPSQGQTLAVTYRYMDIFVIRAGRWQCVASQSTRVEQRTL